MLMQQKSGILPDLLSVETNLIKDCVEVVFKQHRVGLDNSSFIANLKDTNDALVVILNFASIDINIDAIYDSG